MISTQTLKTRFLRRILKLRTMILKWRHRSRIIEYRSRSICKR